MEWFDTAIWRIQQVLLHVPSDRCDRRFWQHWAQALHEARGSDQDLLEPVVVRSLLSRCRGFNPWDMVAVTGCSVDVVVHQLFEGCNAGQLSPVFAACCEQCSAEVTADAPADAPSTVAELFHFFAKAHVSNTSVVCYLCGNIVSLGVVHRDESADTTSFVYDRVKVFFAPVPMQSGSDATSSVLTGNDDGVRLGTLVRPITRIFTSQGFTDRILQQYYLGGQSVSRHEVNATRGRYLLICAELAVAIEVDVLADPALVIDRSGAHNASTSRCSIAFKLSDLLQRRLDRRVTDPSLGEVNAPSPCIVGAHTARHGSLLIELINDTALAGVVEFVRHCDLRLEFVAPCPDVRTASSARLLPVTALLPLLSRGPRCDSVFQLPLAVTGRLPSSCAAVCLRLDWAANVPLHSRLDVFTLVQELCVTQHGGTCIDRNAELSELTLMYRSALFGVAAVLAVSRQLSVDKITRNGGRFAPRSVAGAVVEGSLLAERTRISTSSSVFGAALSASRRLCFETNRLQEKVLAFASAAIAVVASDGSTDLTPRREPPVSVSDDLVSPLLDQLEYRARDWRNCESGPSIDVVCCGVSTISCASLPCGGAASIVHMQADFLASKSCLTLGDMLHPSVIDPMETSCADSA